MTLKKTLLALSILTLGACAQGARVSEMTAAPSSGYTAGYDGPKMKVGTVTGGKETNPLWTSKIDSNSFGEALRSSLQANGMLGASNAPYTVHANIVSFDEPLAGFGIDIASRIQYSVIGSDNAAVIDQLITGNGHASVGDAFLGTKRLQLANEASMRDNIAKFISLARKELSGVPPIGARTEASKNSTPQHYTYSTAQPGGAQPAQSNYVAAPANTQLYQPDYGNQLSYSDRVAQYGQDLKRINDDADQAIEDTRAQCMWGNSLEWIGDQDQTGCEARVTQIEAQRQQAINQLDQKWRGTYMQ